MKDKKTLEFFNLQYDVVNNDLSKSAKYYRVTNNLSGKFTSGNLNAILGQSGAGKSQFFNLLTGDIGKKDKTGGKILYNNQERNIHEWANLVSFLPQDDIYFPKLTLFETLQYYSEFYNIDTKDKNVFFDKILNDCRIRNKKDLTIESLSGGERKRAMLCVAMLKQPEILILDEPTTGLDSHNALLIVDSLKKYAQDKNAIVILTAHQPGEALFNLFDNLLYLTKRGVFYQGKIDELENFLIEHKIHKPDKISLAEFIFELTVEDTFVSEAKNAKKIVEEIIDFNQQKITTEKTERCNNLYAVASWKFNVKHYNVLSSRNYVLLKRSGGLFRFIIFKVVFSIIFFLILYLLTNELSNLCVNYGTSHNNVYAIMLPEWRNHLKGVEHIYDFIMAHFSSSAFAYAIILNAAFSDMIVFDQNIYDFEIKTAKYSPLTFAIFKLLQNFTANFWFILFCFGMFMSFLLKYNFSWQSILLTFIFTTLSNFFYSISMSLVSEIPISSKITSSMFYIFCSFNFLENFLLERSKSWFNTFMILLKIFPHHNFNRFLFFESIYKICNVFKNKLNGLEIAIFQKLKEYYKVFDFRECLHYIGNEEKSFQFDSLIDFWCETMVLLGTIIISTILFITLYVVIWSVRHTPNQRLKISRQ